MNMRLALAAASFVLSPVAQAQEAADPHAGHDHGGHDAYAHAPGLAHLDLVLEGSFLKLKFVAPKGMLFGDDIPKAKRSAAALALMLQDPDDFVTLPRAAKCRRASYEVSQTELTEGAHAGHFNVTAEFGLVCAAPAALDRLSTPVFEPFPKIERVIAHFARPDDFDFHSGAELTDPAQQLQVKLLQP